MDKDIILTLVRMFFLATWGKAPEKTEFIKRVEGVMVVTFNFGDDTIVHVAGPVKTIESHEVTMRLRAVVAWASSEYASGSLVLVNTNKYFIQDNGTVCRFLE